MPAPGVTRDEVAILGGSFFEDMVKWHDVQLYCDTTGSDYVTILYLGNVNYHWIDGVEMYNTNTHWDNCNPINGQGAVSYITNADIHDVMNASISGRLTRNVSVENIGADVFRGVSNQVAINIRVENMDPAPGAHPDLIQFYNPGSTVENGIYYNVKATKMNAQGIFGGTGADGFVEDVAFVNFLMEKAVSNALISQLNYQDHILMWHFTTVDNSIFLRSETTNPNSLTGFNIQNGIFNTLHAGELTELPDSVIANNIYRELTWQQATGMGQDFYIGDPLFVDNVADGNYYLKSNSPGVHAGVVLETVPADINGRPYHPTTPTLGAFAFTPLLDFQGAPDDQMIHLNWDLNVTLPNTTTWRLDYEGAVSGPQTPITNIPTPTRAYTLTGLTNYEWYTVTLTTEPATLTETITIMPTDQLQYLPAIYRD